jgi:SAM-dependent methyltransferase
VGVSVRHAARDSFAQQQQERSADRFRVLDAGSGVTFFPYYLRKEIPRSEITCFDSNTSYHPMFAAVNKTMGETKVKFEEGMLQKLPFESDTFDAVCCISVLEHTSNYGEILDEFARVLRPGGLLVLTFDFVARRQVRAAQNGAAELLTALSSKFNVPADSPSAQELDRMDDPARERILTTDYIRDTQPDLLPWKHPTLKARHMTWSKGTDGPAGFAPSRYTASM